MLPTDLLSRSSRGRTSTSPRTFPGIAPDGNGRTARLWANSLAVRYGLPQFIRLRPKPNAGYGDAGAKSMQGDWKPIAVVFRRLLSDFLAEG